MEETPAEHADTTTVDAEEKKLREKMQEVLAKAAKAALPSTTEVVDLVETASPVSKRPRSTEPGAGQQKDATMQGGSS